MSLQEVPVDAIGIPWEQWMEQQRERIFAEARTKRLAASGPSALAQSPMVQQTTQLSPIPAAQAGLPIDDVVRA
jgi:hypothetical protein